MFRCPGECDIHFQVKNKVCGVSYINCQYTEFHGFCRYVRFTGQQPDWCGRERLCTGNDQPAYPHRICVRTAYIGVLLLVPGPDFAHLHRVPWPVPCGYFLFPILTGNKRWPAPITDRLKKAPIAKVWRLPLNRACPCKCAKSGPGTSRRSR